MFIPRVSAMVCTPESRYEMRMRWNSGRTLQSDGDKAGSNRRRRQRRICWLDEIGDAESAQHVLDRVVDFAQRLFDGAGAVQVASAVNGDATGDKQRAVDGADDLEGINLRGWACQRVAAVGSCRRDQDAPAGQCLQNFGEQLRWNVIRIGDGLRR